MIVKNINEVINALINDYSSEERIEFDKSFDKNTIYNTLSSKNDLTSLDYFLLGELYFSGIGVEQDYSKSFECYNKALSLGLKRAAQDIAGFYSSGKYVEQDMDLAKKYFEIAAKAGYAFSWYNLGIIYMNGLGSTLEDAAKGVECFKKASDIGFRKAMEMVGKCYFNGVGVEKNEEESEKWFAMAYGDDWYFKIKSKK